jgi:serine/threonine protein phosphatase PrpC
MTALLKVSVGQFSDKGQKKINQDFHGVKLPDKLERQTKGIALALADGISSSSVSQIASQTAVTNFLNDYYCTSEAWSVKHSGEKVIQSLNNWLFSETQRSPYKYEKDKGYVCTFSAIILKANSAHIFHIGDSRIYRIIDNALEQLTNDHRLYVSQQESYLSKALGIENHSAIDYRQIPVKPDDVFVLATDGIYEHVDPRFIIDEISNSSDLNSSAKNIGIQALSNGSNDNLTIQILKVDATPQQNDNELQQEIDTLELPPVLQEGMQFDGFHIIRSLHISARSHVFLAQDIDSKKQVVLKTPSMDMRSDEQYLELFLMEEWIAKRIHSPYVLSEISFQRPKKYIYTLTEYIEGKTLAQWMRDQTHRDIESVRIIIEQVAKGLRAFHRMDMLHQDLKPDNVMITATGNVKIIDFGAVFVAGIAERYADQSSHPLRGTALYSAPEYFLGRPGSQRSDQFSLGVLTYALLSGKYPYGTKVAQSTTPAAQHRLTYLPLTTDNSDIPMWADEAIRKAVHIHPSKRYEEISEFIHDLRHPNTAFLNKNRPPLIERNPVAFWKGVSSFLLIIIIFLIFAQYLNA